MPRRILSGVHEPYSIRRRPAGYVRSDVSITRGHPQEEGVRGHRRRLLARITREVDSEVFQRELKRQMKLKIQRRLMKQMLGVESETELIKMFLSQLVGTELAHRAVRGEDAPLMRLFHAMGDRRYRLKRHNVLNMIEEVIDDLAR